MDKPREGESADSDGVAEDGGEEIEWEKGGGLGCVDVLEVRQEEGGELGEGMKHHSARACKEEEYKDRAYRGDKGK